MRPVVDGRVIPHLPFEPGAPDLAADVPTMIGTTETEGTYNAADVVEMDDADMHRRLRAPTSLGSEADRIIELFQKNRPHATPAEIYFTITAMPLVAIKQAEQKAAQGNAEMVGTGPDIQPLADKVSATWAAFAHGQSEQFGHSALAPVQFGRTVDDGHRQSMEGREGSEP
jgi:hypothetical protein